MRVAVRHFRDRGLLLAAGALGAGALLEGIQFYFQQGRHGLDEPLSRVIMLMLIPWSLLALLVPLVVAVTRWIAIDRSQLRGLGLHFGAALLFAAAHLTLVASVGALRDPESFPFILRVGGLLNGYTLQDVIVYAAIVAFLHARQSQPSLAEVKAVSSTSIAIRGTSGTTYVAVDDVDWIQADSYYARIHTAGKAHLLRESLQSLSSRLDARFVRIHRSAIVRVDRIRELRRKPSGELTAVLATGHSVPVSRARASELQARLNQR